MAIEKWKCWNVCDVDWLAYLSIISFIRLPSVLSWFVIWKSVLIIRWIALHRCLSICIHVNSRCFVCRLSDLISFYFGLKRAKQWITTLTCRERTEATQCAPRTRPSGQNYVVHIESSQLIEQCAPPETLSALNGPVCVPSWRWTMICWKCCLFQMFISIDEIVWLCVQWIFYLSDLDHIASTFQWQCNWKANSLTQVLVPRQRQCKVNICSGIKPSLVPRIRPELSDRCVNNIFLINILRTI